MFLSCMCTPDPEQSLMASGYDLDDLGRGLSDDA